MENKNIIGREITYYELAEIVCKYSELNKNIDYAFIKFKGKTMIPTHTKKGKAIFNRPEKDGVNCMTLSHARILKDDWKNYIIVMPGKKKVVNYFTARVNRIVSKYSQKPVTCLEINLVMD